MVGEADPAFRLSAFGRYLPVPASEAGIRFAERYRLRREAKPGRYPLRGAGYRRSGNWSVPDSLSVPEAPPPERSSGSASPTTSLALAPLRGESYIAKAAKAGILVGASRPQDVNPVRGADLSVPDTGLVSGADTIALGKAGRNGQRTRSVR